MNPTGAAPFDSGSVDALLRAFAGGSLLIATYDPDDILRYASAAFKSAFALTDIEGTMKFGDLILRGFHYGMGPKIEDPHIFIADAQQRRRRSPGQRFFTTDMPDGSWYWMNETLLDDGWLVLVGTEISPLKETERQLTRAHEQALHEARTDALTGLPNRRQVLAYLDRTVATSSGPETPLSIALIDLDRFKTINDEHGHLTGDAVLCDFAFLTRNIVRRSDVVGRIGGEEFLIVMPGTTVDEAVQLAERMRSAVVSRATVSPGGARVQYSISVGVTQVFSKEGTDEAFSRADRALYEAKSRGRNRVWVA